MKKYSQNRWIVLSAFSFVFLLTFSLFIRKSEAVQMPSAQAVQKNYPITLVVPALHITTAIESLGVTTTGEMDVPKGPKTVSWYDLGPRPGDSGSAVIAGHYGWKNGIPAVFDKLRLLKKGDVVYVKNARGMTTKFVVRKVAVFSEKDSATSVFLSTDKKAHLNLITCGGIWNKNTKSYSSRTVVFTDAV